MHVDYIKITIFYLKDFKNLLWKIYILLHEILLNYCNFPLILIFLEEKWSYSHFDADQECPLTAVYLLVLMFTKFNFVNDGLISNNFVQSIYYTMLLKTTNISLIIYICNDRKKRFQHAKSRLDLSPPCACYDYDTRWWYATFTALLCMLNLCAIKIKQIYNQIF